jgi:hypothetical protein
MKKQEPTAHGIPPSKISAASGFFCFVDETNTRYIQHRERITLFCEKRHNQFSPLFGVLVRSRVLNLKGKKKKRKQ